MPTLNSQDLEKSACSCYSESNKACKDPKSYWTISLLSVPNKILDRLIHVYVDPINNSLLPKEQAGFRSQKSTVYQVVLLTYNIEDSFRTKEKTRAVFFNLTVAYDTVWFRGLTCKLLKFLLNKHTVRIMELVRNRSLSLATGGSKQTRLHCMKNGVPQESVLALLLFNIYTYGLPSMIFKKFAYADNLALLHSSGNWKDFSEGTSS